MGTIQSDSPVATQADTSRTSNAKKNSKFGTYKVKVSAFKKTINYLKKKLRLSTKQKKAEKLAQRKITEETPKQKNSLKRDSFINL